METGTYTAVRSHFGGYASTYKRQEIEMASPEKLILLMYDLGIQSCKKKDMKKAGAVFASLIDALNFDIEGDVSTGLFRLYEYCIKMVHQKEYDIPLKILQELRETWAKALAQMKAA